MSRRLRIDVVFARPGQQSVVGLELAPGARVGDALRAAAARGAFSESDVAGLAVGVYGSVVTYDHLLADGDRVEIYRPLALDPKQARRRRADFTRRR